MTVLLSQSSNVSSLPMPHEERVSDLFTCGVLLLTGCAKIFGCWLWGAFICYGYGFAIHYPESFVSPVSDKSDLRRRNFGSHSSGVTWCGSSCVFIFCRLSPTTEEKEAFRCPCTLMNDTDKCKCIFKCCLKEKLVEPKCMFISHLYERRESVRA